MQVFYSQHVLDELRELNPTMRKSATRAMRGIVEDPWSPRQGRCELPPMWRPGTYSQAFDDFTITYCRDIDGENEALRFLHVRTDTGFGFGMM